MVSKISTEDLSTQSGVNPETEVFLNVKEVGRTKCNDFDKILTLIGPQGKYQKLLVYAFVVPLIIIAPIIDLSFVFLMDIPEHWCHVPGQENYTTEQWKNLTIPMKMGPDGDWRHSQCNMFEFEDGDIIPCRHGYEYDKTNYESTIPSAHDWVCEKIAYSTQVLSMGTAGAAIGTIVFGIIADKMGRKPAFFIATTLYIFRTVSYFFPHYPILFRFLWFLSSAASTTIYLNPAMAIAEVSGSDYRSWIYGVIWMVWVVGNAFIPFIAYFARTFLLFGLITSLPVLIIFVYYPFIMESPRWLLTVGQGDKAFGIIKKIAKINGMTIDEKEVKLMVEDLLEKQKLDSLKNKHIGVWTLFQHKRLALHTILLCIATSINGLLYYAITLNTTTIKGNIFLNYFYLAIIELPAGYLGATIVEKVGRRWTQSGFFLMSALSCAWSAVTAISSDFSFLVIFGALGIKFGVSVSSLVVSLQGTEVFPTQLRSTGIGLATTVSCIIAITGPLIVFTGKWYPYLPYVMLTILAGLGAILAAFLPETLNQSLPETVEEADNFGKEQKFWSYLPEDVAKIRAERRASRISKKRSSVII